MKVWPILVAFGVLAISACQDSSGPDGATITFKTDRVACAYSVDFEITIDGERQGSYRFAPGSEWTFSVSAGTHSIRAQGETPESGFAIIEREVTVSEGGNFTVLLTCIS